MTKQTNFVELTANAAEKNLKFSEWYFNDALEVSIRPDLFVERKKYFKELKEKITGTNMHTLVFAYPGQGKTLSTKIFFNDWERKENTIHYIYINCKKENTEKKVFRAVIQEMSKIYPPVLEIEKENERTAISEFVKNIPKGQRYFLILDEIDVPLKFDPNKGEWLTVFFRAEEGTTSEPQPLRWHVLMITNKIAFEQSLDVNERQHIQHMGLSVYIPQDIYDIIAKRIAVGVKNDDISQNLFSEEILFEIAKTTVDTYDSNVRTAFSLVNLVAEKAILENTPANKEHILAAQKDLEIDMYLNDLAQMTKSAQLFYFSTLIFLTTKSKESRFKDMEKRGYSTGLYKSFFLSDVYPIYNKFYAVNRLSKQKAVERNSQRYINEGIQIGLYKQTGLIVNKFREFEVTLDPKEVFKLCNLFRSKFYS